MEIFTGSFTQQDPIPDEGIAAALQVLRHGRLHRYNTAPGEVAETALLEEEFAALTGAKYCLAVASGGYALATALRACGVQPGDRVLTNAFTLAPVPGAIAGLGAVPVFVGVTQGLVIDLDDLAAKLPQARVLMLSHMRGHICDMDALMALCDAAGVTVIEDCAHTMGARWNGTLSGRHGRMACYSTQTYKHVNSGEGGLLISDDAAAMARAIMLSGSYMLFDRHRAAPPPEAFATIRYETPNISGRMDNLRAAILRPQLRDLEAQCARWNDRYRVVEDGSGRHPRPDPDRPARGRALRGLVLPVPAAGLARRRDPRGAVALCGPRGRAEMVRRARTARLHLALRQLALCALHADAGQRPHPARDRRHAPAADLQP